MPSCCGQGATCSCKIETTGRLHVDGSGQPGDPFVLSIDAALEGGHNSSFDVVITGDGTSVTSPWVVETRYAATARLDDIPDVNAPAPSNGQVLGWDAGSGRWVAQAATVAPTGAVLHNTTLSGDGSSGSPLSVVADTARFIGAFSTGVGMTDTGIADLVQHFSDSANRALLLPSPRVNALSMLDTTGGKIEYWDGTKWLPAVTTTRWRPGTPILTLSGPYADGSPVTIVTGQVSTTTDANGVFSAVPAADLSGFSGVLNVSFQETGSLGWAAVLNAATDHMAGTAYRLSDGSLLASTPVSGWYSAACY